METMTFLELAEKIIQEEKRPLTPEEIWRSAQAKGYDKRVNTQGKTPWQTISAQIYVNIRDKADSRFIKAESRPTRFFLKLLNLASPGPTIGELLTGCGKEITSKPLKPKYMEKELHPFLAYFGYYYLKAYLKTIYHSKSSKSEYGEWIHPDMVGCYYPLGSWEKEVIEFGSAIGNMSIKLFSFEIKRELSFANLRASFFQTVSNSSWANEGYLVAAEIASDEDFLNELGRLSTSFGIGVIRLNIEDPDATEVLFPAKNREYLDWDAINKLCSMNTDFREFLTRIKKDLVNQEIIKERYDRILEKSSLIEMLEK